MKFFLIAALLLLSYFGGTAQKADYSVLTIPEALKENANAVVRNNEYKVAIKSQDQMTIHIMQAVTVLNEHGASAMDLAHSYDGTTHISHIEARVFNAMGQQTQIFKKRDFKDVSAADGFSVFNESRLLYLDYTPISYPFTMEIDVEMTTSNTAWIRPWSAFSGYFVSTQRDMLEIAYPENVGFSSKEVNFDPKIPIARTDSSGMLTYVATDLKALKGEEGSPESYKIAPIVYPRIDKFSLEGVLGQATSWKEFGKWYYDKLLTGTDELLPETVAKIKLLVGDEKDPIAIARKIYKFVQDRTRYVSIQIGIGGFKPMKASDVDKLGYGDCKALTNYTRSLLQVVGVTSYYTVVYSGRETRRSLVSDVVSVQGDHVILAIPVKGDYVWLECTSQDGPFGYQGLFTDGRDVLVVKPDGGEIVRTHAYAEKENSQVIAGSYNLAADGGLSGTLSITSAGGKYDNNYEKERLSAKEKESWYKDRFGNIGNLKLGGITFKNDKDNVVFTEQIGLSAASYANASADRLIFVLNAFDLENNTPKRYRSRQNPFEVERGYWLSDAVSVTLPEGYTIESLPEDYQIETKYGQYKTHIIKKDEHTLQYERSLLIHEGYYENTEYESYRLFREQVAKNDNAKVVLLRKT